MAQFQSVISTVVALLLAGCPAKQLAVGKPSGITEPQVFAEVETQRKLRPSGAEVARRPASSTKPARRHLLHRGKSQVKTSFPPFEHIIQDVLEGVGLASPKVKVPIDVYYESQCPDSLKFLNNTLRQVWESKELNDVIDVRLFPFGNAQLLSEERVHEGYRFFHPDAQYPLIVCEHGEVECLGNVLQACAIEQLFYAEQYVPFVLCMAEYGSDAGVELPSYICGKQHNVDMYALRECSESEDGHEMMVRSGIMSLPPHVNRTSTPWVVVNGTHSEEAEAGDLVGPVCRALVGHPDAPQLRECQNANLMRSNRRHTKRSEGSARLNILNGQLSAERAVR